MYSNLKSILPLFLLTFFSLASALGQNVPEKRDSLIKAATGVQPGTGSGLNQKNSAEPQKIEQPERVTQKSDYKDAKKEPTSTVFGAEFFNTASLSFEPNLRIAAPAGYILGPDDELIISVSGYQETNIRTSVQPEGTIFIPQVGSINVAGLAMEAAIARIQARMGQTAYPSLKNNLSKLAVSLGKIRSIHITIVGAYKPGNYTVSSLSTVFNALSLCGGPGAINSYRDIELIRGGKIYQKIDIYQFLRRGDQQGNVPLKEGDVINFPVYKKHVTLAGEVKSPGIFELKNNETFQDLLFFAGGYSDKAYRASVKVKQITDTERKVKDLGKADLAIYRPENGDVLIIDAVLDRVENAVSINGAVFRPGEFELTPGLTVGGLIKRAGGLLDNVFTERATLTRTYADGTRENFTFNIANVLNGGAVDMPLVKRDVVNIATRSEFLTDYQIQVSGEVRKPGTFAFKQNLSLKDGLFMAGGFTDAASSYNIEVGRRIITDRLDKNLDSIAKVYELHLEKGFTIENDKFILQPFDIVTVRRNPGYMEQQQVTVSGEVTFPGSYIISSKTERISDLLKRVGGLTPVAYKQGVFLIRSNTQNNNDLQEEVKAIQKNIRDTSSKIIDDLTRNNAKIAVNLQKVLDDPGSIEDYILQDGDVLNVFKLDPLVKVSGEVLSSTKTGFVTGRSLRYYLSQAGGTTEKARRSKIYVLYANGRIKRTWNGIAGLFRSYPTIETGSEIVVPRILESKKLSVGEILGITSGIVSLSTLIIVTIFTLRK